MNEKERFDLASAIFLEAVKLPPERVQAFVDQRSAGDAELRTQVLALLRAAKEESVFRTLENRLESVHGRLREDITDRPTLPSGGVPGAAPAGAEEKTDDRIGRYRLLEMIGEGGFGRVWVAEQHEPVQRRVAMKIIKAGMDTRQVVARFEQERQALALMDHPNIAKVFDAGMTHTGRPFFVMELCKGQDLLSYCDTHRLKIRERLELFAQICSAVQHAHTKGVIHRDIKPGNVLVATQDGRAHAKVIDFGIAKAIDTQLTEKTLYTEHRQMVGTPEYMSPEQAEGSLDIDSRTDVYSLGVLLYELLTGSTPFTSHELRSAAFGEMQRIIREVDPPKPSTRLSQSADSLPGVALQRQVEPRRLSGIVRGDLDWVVMKTLEKDRARRYESASGLADDIRRYLAGEPVQAAPPSRVYQLRKFAKRNRGLVGSLGGVGAALMLGLVAFAWQASVARGQRDLALQARLAEAQQRAAADAQRDRAIAAEAQATLRAEELKQVSEFQSQMLEQVDIEAAGLSLSGDIRERLNDALAKSGLDESQRAAQVATFASLWGRVNATDVATTMIDRTILKPALSAIDRQFADQPGVKAKLHQVLSDRYYKLGRYEDSLAQADLVLAILEDAFGRDDPRWVEAATSRAHVLTALGKAPEAESALREILSTRASTLAMDEAMRLLVMNNLCVAIVPQGKTAEAIPLLRETLSGRRRLLGEGNEGTLATQRNLAEALRITGDLSGAEDITQDLLVHQRRTLGESHRNTLSVLNDLGAVKYAQGKYAEAESLFRQAAEGRKRTDGEAHPSTLQDLQNLSNALSKLDRLDEAMNVQRETVASLRRVLGPDHPSTLNALSNLGVFLTDAGKFEEAEAACREALEGRVRILGESNPQTLISYNVMSYVYRRENKLPDAEVMLRKAYEISAKVLGEDHPDRLTFLINMATTLDDQKKFDEAEALYRQAIERCARVLGPAHPYTNAASSGLGRMLVGEGKFEPATILLTKYEADLRAAQISDSVLAQALLYLGQAKAGLMEFAPAEAKLLEAREVYLKSRGPSSKGAADATRSLADLYGEWEKADPGKGHDAQQSKWRALVK